MKSYDLFKKVAFQLDPEMAHNLSMGALSSFPKKMSQIFSAGRKCSNFDLEKYDLSLTLKDGNYWSFPVGLAAGLDKNAEAINFFTRILFGAVEVGTVTPKPQEGNPRPRMFRLKEDESLLNRMGFNNEGMERTYLNIVRSDRHGKVLGVNLGKNKVTPQDKACEDYQKLYEKFAPVANYLIVNVSSPNTPGLRDLQNINALKEIFDALKDQRAENDKPLYLKIAPDLAMEDLPGIVELAHDYKLAGLIATNTTIMPEVGQGGVSGKLLTNKSRHVRNRLLEIMGKDSPLEMIGVGGISSFDEILDFWKNGGRATQIYTSFIYQGPEILFDIEARIIELLKKNEIVRLSEFIDNIHKVDC